MVGGWAHKESFPEMNSTDYAVGLQRKRTRLERRKGFAKSWEYLETAGVGQGWNKLVHLGEELVNIESKAREGLQHSNYKRVYLYNCVCIFLNS